MRRVDAAANRIVIKMPATIASVRFPGTKRVPPRPGTVKH